jgi:serine/threonine-protein kinase
LTGRPPASAQERFLLPESLPHPCALNPNLSPSVAEAVLLAMAAHPKDRPASVEFWRQILRGSVSTAPLSLSQPAGQLWPAILRENWWLVALAVTLLAAALWLTFS